MANYSIAKSPEKDNAGLSSIAGNIDDMYASVDHMIARLEQIHSALYGNVPRPAANTAPTPADSIDSRLSRLRSALSVMSDRIVEIEMGGRS